MKEITASQLLNAFNKHTYPIFKSTKEKPYNIMLWGCRSKDTNTATYNDLIGYMYFNTESDSWVIKQYLGTTDPGLYYLQNPINTKGAAYLVPGFYKGVYQIGMHGGPKSRHEALVQIKNMTYQRDGNKNRFLDPDAKTYVENAATNLHSGWDNSTLHLINHDSAGCQVIAKHAEQVDFMKMIHKSATNYGNIFSYYLITENDIV